MDSTVLIFEILVNSITYLNKVKIACYNYLTNHASHKKNRKSKNCCGLDSFSNIIYLR